MPRAAWKSNRIAQHIARPSRRSRRAAKGAAAARVGAPAPHSAPIPVRNPLVQANVTCSGVGAVGSIMRGLRNVHMVAAIPFTTRCPAPVTFPSLPLGHEGSGRAAMSPTLVGLPSNGSLLHAAGQRSVAAAASRPQAKLAPPPAVWRGSPVDSAHLVASVSACSGKAMRLPPDEKAIRLPPTEKAMRWPPEPQAIWLPPFEKAMRLPPVLVDQGYQVATPSSATFNCTALQVVLTTRSSPHVARRTWNACVALTAADRPPLHPSRSLNTVTTHDHHDSAAEQVAGRRGSGGCRTS